MITLVTGDLFKLKADIRVNTVNCVGVMGKGIALQFKNRHPDMFLEYKRACERGEVRVGSLHVWKTSSEWIINFPTKKDWQQNSEYVDIETGLDALRQYLEPLGGLTVALPALGCNNGGLQWVRVCSLICTKLKGLEAKIFAFRPVGYIEKTVTR